MRNIVSRAAELVAGCIMCAASALSWSADGEAPKGLAKQFESLGIDAATFDRLFGNVFKEKPAEPPSETMEELADQVTELRLFLTTEPNVVIGEIVLSGKTRLKAITLSMEGAPVVFKDSGAGPDRAAVDGVFAARFKMDTTAAFSELRQDLAASIDVLRGRSKARFVRRGPRDIVPVKDFLETMKAREPQQFKLLSEHAERGARILERRTPLDAAKALGLAIDKTPFIVIPGPRPRPDAPTIRFLHLFGIPIVFPFPHPLPPIAVDTARSLMVVHTGVVDDSTRTIDACTGTGTVNGAWSFGHLMRELAHGTGLTPEDFALLWLSQWQIAQEANGWLVDEPARGAAIQRVIASWTTASGGVLNIDRFPARLLAIVNRPDLADRIGYGTAGSAGEGRLVFSLLDKTANACTSLPFTVIFEFGIRGGSCSAVKAWHQRWKDLDLHPLGSLAYNAALETITRDFTDHGTNPGQTPNLSSLNQLRTNEIALGATWQLREFRLQPVGSSVPAGLLDLVTVKQTPDTSLNVTPTLAAYLIANEADILADRHVVPGRFPTVLDRFLGAKSDLRVFDEFWSSPLPGTLPPNRAEARRKFSLGTCNACHGGETQTIFTHIGIAGRRAAGSPAQLSGFLTGIDVTVPISFEIHHYNDLAERQAAMSRILTQPCFRLLGTRRIPFVH